MGRIKQRGQRRTAPLPAVGHVQHQQQVAGAPPGQSYQGGAFQQALRAILCGPHPPDQAEQCPDKQGRGPQRQDVIDPPRRIPKHLRRCRHAQQQRAQLAAQSLQRVGGLSIDGRRLSRQQELHRHAQLALPETELIVRVEIEIFDRHLPAEQLQYSNGSEGVSFRIDYRMPEAERQPPGWIVHQLDLHLLQKGLRIWDGPHWHGPSHPGHTPGHHIVDLNAPTLGQRPASQQRHQCFGTGQIIPLAERLQRPSNRLVLREPTGFGQKALLPGQQIGLDAGGHAVQLCLPRRLHVAFEPGQPQHPKHPGAQQESHQQQANLPVAARPTMNMPGLHGAPALLSPQAAGRHPQLVQFPRTRLVMQPHVHLKGRGCPRIPVAPDQKPMRLQQTVFFQLDA